LQPHFEHRTTSKLGIFLLACAVVVVAVLYALSHPLHDFLEYWTAAHLLVRHQNPYSLPEMSQAQKSLGWTEHDPLMFVSPPWALPLILPLGFLGSYSFAWVLWVVILMSAVAISSFVLMNVYFDDLRIPEVTETTFERCLFAFTFYPVILCLKFAQTTPFILLGLAGFLYFDLKRRPVAAGVLLSLTLIKPQLLVLVWLAILFRSVQQREWRTLGSVSGVVVSLTAIAAVFDHAAFRNYHELIATPYLQINPSGMLGILRRWLNRGDVTATYWMQFVLPVLGVGWFVIYWRKHNHEWNWTEQMPVLVTASVLTAAYGWIFDQAVLALPIIALAAATSRTQSRLAWNLVIFYTVLNCALMLLMVLPPLTYIPTPLALVMLFLGRKTHRTVAPISGYEGAEHQHVS
jgi:hypothetical protein